MNKEARIFKIQIITNYAPLNFSADIKKDKKMNRLSKIRFGHQVQFEKYQTSNSIKVLCITLAIIIIPLEIFVQHVL